MYVVVDRLSADDEADSIYATEVLRCPAKIKGRTVGGMIDIGSEVNVISRELAEHLGLLVDVLSIEVTTPFLILKAGDE
ncbi:hypothetical protein McaMca56_007462 [Microsporum canis]